MTEWQTPTRGDRVTAGPSTGDFPAELELLRGTATAVINEHLNDAGLCAICGSAWPCERVQLAEHNLAVL